MRWVALIGLWLLFTASSAQADGPSETGPSEVPPPPFEIQPPGPGTTSTDGVQRVVPTLAAVDGGVCACNQPVAVRFQYGPTTAYGSLTPPYQVPAATSNGRVNVGGLLTGLLPGSQYHFRIMVTGTNGSFYGGDLAFTTPSLDPVLTIFTQGRIGVLNGVAQAVVGCRGDPGDTCHGSVQLSVDGQVIGSDAFSVALGDSLLVALEQQNGPAPVTLTTTGNDLLSKSRYLQAEALVTVERGSPITTSVLLYNDAQSQSARPTPTVARCVIPNLKHRTLARAKTLLARAHCKLGKVDKSKRNAKVRLVVVGQRPGAKKTMAAGTRVSVRLG